MQNHNSNLLYRTIPTRPMSCVGACELRGSKLHLAVSSYALGNTLPPQASLQFGWLTGLVCLLIKWFPAFTYQIVGLPLFILMLFLSVFKLVLPSPALVLVYIFLTHPMIYHSSLSANSVSTRQLKSQGKNSKQF